MSITSFFKSLFGGSRAPQAVQKRKQSKSTKSIAKTRTKAKRKNQSHPWLAAASKKIVMDFEKHMTARPDAVAYSTIISAPQYMDLHRARRLTANNLIRIYGSGRVKTLTDKDDHSIAITILK